MVIYPPLQVLAVVLGDGGGDSAGGGRGGGDAGGDAPAAAGRGVSGAVAGRSVGRDDGRDIGDGADIAAELGGSVAVDGDGDSCGTVVCWLVREAWTAGFQVREIDINPLADGQRVIQYWL